MSDSSLTVGTLTAKMDLDTAGLTAGLAKTDAKMAETAAHGESSANRIGSAFKKFGSELGELAIAEFAKQSVEAFSEAEQATTKLNDVFERTPKLADSSAEAIHSLNEELSKNSRYTVASLDQGAAQLAQFGLTGKQLAADMPILVDYAARTGQDIPAAASALGKAALGSTRALKNIGIDMKATHDRAKDLATVFTLVGQKTAGYAQKDLTTAAGRMANFNKQLDEMKVALGSVLVPILEEVATPLGQIAQGAQAAAEGFAKLPGPVRDTALALAAVYAVTKVGLFSGLTGGLAKVKDNVAVFRLMSSSTASAEQGISRLGLAARQVGSGLASMGSKVLGMFGGPLGLAIVGVTAVMAIWSNENAKAKAQVDEHNAAVQDLTDSLDKVSGALTEASTESLNKELEGSSDAYKAIGSSVGEASAAITEGGDELDKYREKLLGMSLAQAIATAKQDDNSRAVKSLSERYGIDLAAAAVKGGQAQADALAKLRPYGVDLDAVSANMNGFRASVEAAHPGLQAFDAAVSAADDASKQARTSFLDAATAAEKLAGFKGSPEQLIAGLDKASKAGKSVESVLGQFGITGASATKFIGAMGDKVTEGAGGLHYFSQAAADASEKTADATAANQLAAGSFKLVGDSAADAVPNVKGISDQLSLVSTAATDADNSTQFLQATLDRLAGRSQTAEDALRLEETSLRGIAKASRDEADAKDNVIQAQEDLTAARKQGVDKDHSATDNALALRKAERDLADAQADVKDKTDAKTDADLKAVRAIEQQVSAVADVTLHQRGLAAASDAAGAKMAVLRGEFIKSQEAAGLSADAAAKLADKYGLIPANVRTSIIAEDGASPDINQVSTLLGQLPRSVQIAISGSSQSIVQAVDSAIGAIQRMTLTPGYGKLNPNVNEATAGGYAVGGEVSGGIPGTDSVPMLGMPGEHVLTTNDVGLLGGQAGVYRFRRELAAGRVGRYASGGSVPSGGSLAGLDAYQPGNREGNVSSAIADLASAVSDFAQAAADARSTSADAATAARQAKSDQASTRGDQASKVADVRASNAARLTSAEQALTAARNKSHKSAAEAASRNAAITKAEEKLTATRTANAQALAKATTAQQKANAAAAAHAAAAQRTATADARAAAVATSRAAAEARVQRAEAGMRSELVTLGRQYDANETKLGTLTDKLADLQSKAADVTSSIQGNVTGIGGGILGSDSFTGSATTAGDIITSLQQNAATAKGFDANIAKLVSLGLNPAAAEQVANADPTGRGGVVAQALAGATKAQVAQINALLAQQASIGATTGKRIAGAEYGAQISATNLQISATNLQLRVEAAEAAKIGNTIAAATRAAMTGQRVTIAIGNAQLQAVVKSVVAAESSAAVRQAAGYR
jgi:hypothetical protein